MNADAILPYLQIARADHWFKNVFMLPGVALAVIMSPHSVEPPLLQIVLAFVALCLLASANYTINEWLDAGYDRFHPVKKHRPSVTGDVKASLVAVQYGVLAALGLGLALQLSASFTWLCVVFLLLGLFYNVKPVRAKDRAYLDILCEALNNPVRLLLGWVAVLPASLPPSSVVMAYWMVEFERMMRMLDRRDRNAPANKFCP